MPKVITFSRYFPAYHPRKGEPTYFVEQIQNSLISMNWEIDLYKDINPPMEFLESLTKEYVGYKHNTIRAGNRWKIGDKFSPRVWSGKPYNSKQIIIAPDIEIKKVWNIELQIDPFLPMEDCAYVLKVNDKYENEETTFSTIKELAKNDGLTPEDFINWFIHSPKVEVFSGQIICWNENIIY